MLRIKVPNTGAMVELSSKFGAPSGEAVDLIEAAFRAGLVVEGLSFHVGSQCTNFANYVQALNLAAGIFHEAWDRGYPQVKILDIGGGFPAPYDANVKPFRQLARTLNAEFKRLFPADMEILAEPGRFLVGTAATLVATVIGKAVRDGRQCYYINDGVYHTFSGIIFDHCQYHVQALRKRADPDFRGLRADLRRAGYRLAGRAAAGTGAGRPGLQREHRRLQPRLVHALQRFSPRQGRAHQPRSERWGAERLTRGPGTGPGRGLVRTMLRMVPSAKRALHWPREPLTENMDLSPSAPGQHRVQPHNPLAGWAGRGEFYLPQCR